MYYQLSKVAHFIGLTMLVGTTVVDFFIAKQFWKMLAIDRSKSIAIQDVVSKFGILFAIGGSTIIISGVIMLGVTHWSFTEQIWFQIKFMLAIMIILNGNLYGKRQSNTLRKILQEAPSAQAETELMNIKRNLSVYYLSQMVLFVTIFTLSVFKFN
ncbi:MAG TPA: hypothetical protein VIM75_22945 [Ohtaekwangia sp.]|uniref:hypothetical protein n=1 Tax=Ohtaekwangia sp. TaxID=2066019 RepID=UPI002F933220